MDYSKKEKELRGQIEECLKDVFPLIAESDVSVSYGRGIGFEDGKDYFNISVTLPTGEGYRIGNGILKELTKCGCEKVKNLEEVTCDCQMVDLGYKCKGHLYDDPLYGEKCAFYRLWLWENEKGEQVVTLDGFSNPCEFVPFEIAIDRERYNQWVMER
jgi:hypothetical protein